MVAVWQHVTCKAGQHGKRLGAGGVGAGPGPYIPREAILRLLERPALARALWWATLVDEAVLRERVVGLGARSAEARVAHLLCELLLRLRAVGLAQGDAYELPLTQAELADAMGVMLELGRPSYVRIACPRAGLGLRRPRP